MLELDLKDVLELDLLGLPHDLEIGKCTTTSTTISYSLTKLVIYEGKFSMDVCPPVALYLVDRSWRIILIIGIFLFSMLWTQHLWHGFFIDMREDITHNYMKLF